MSNEELIRELVTTACREALQQKSQELADDVARRTSAALALQPLQSARTKELRDGARRITGSKTQTETLEALLAAVSVITPTCGLMILRGAQAIGWGCHGLATPESFKRVTLDCSRGIAATVISSCAARAPQVSELDPAFTAALGLTSSARVLLVPVLLKERVAALLIALPQHGDDLAGVELLGQVAELTLDLQTYRKAAPAPPAAPPHAVAQPARPEPVPHAPEPVYAAAMPARAVVAAPPVEVAIPAFRQDATAPQTFQPSLDESHEKARRFAKLLVEEIKLYNQTKLAEGRAQGDIYSRLREDIEKSRGAYQKRFGESIKDADYFSQELMRILADNNRAVMGPGFSG
jgi:hypothetical protein